MNDRVFADTHYWVAILNPKDQWHLSAIELTTLLGQFKIVTTETVLIEVLNYFAESGEHARSAVLELVQAVIEDDEVLFIPHDPEIFSKLRGLYGNRLDKGYSATDCVSLITMKELNIQEILTHDNHFAQEGFVVLL